MTSLSIVPFGIYTARVERPDFVGDTPRGRRMVVGIRDARWEGEEFSASQCGDTAADWLIQGPDGTAMFDVRMSLRADDGAFVFVEYQGRADWSAGPGTSDGYIGPRFETGDERYLWMNKVQFVGSGGLRGDRVEYQVFRLA